MDGPVITGADMIRIIDERGGIEWSLEGKVRFLRPPDSSELQIGVRLIRITTKLSAPHHCRVASPFFSQGGQVWVVLEQDGSRNNCNLPGLPQTNRATKAAPIQVICRTHHGKLYKPTQGIRFLLSQ